MRFCLALILFCAPLCALAEEDQPSSTTGAEYIGALLQHYESSYVPPSAEERCEATLLYAESLLASELVNFDFELDLRITGRGDEFEGVTCVLSSRRTSDIQTSSESE